MASPTVNVTFHYDGTKLVAALTAMRHTLERFAAATRKMLGLVRVPLADLHEAESERWIIEAHRHFRWHAVSLACKHAFLAEWHRALGTTVLRRRGSRFPPSRRIRCTLPTKEMPNGQRNFARAEPTSRRLD